MHKINKRRFVVRTAYILALFWVASICCQVGFYASGKLEGGMVFNPWTVAVIVVSQLAACLLMAMIVAAFWFKTYIYCISLVAIAAIVRLLVPSLLTDWQNASFNSYCILTVVMLFVAAVFRLKPVKQWLCDINNERQ